MTKIKKPAVTTAGRRLIDAEELISQGSSAVNHATIRAPRGQIVEASDKTEFIPAWLDDAPLSLLEFRLFCRVSRRGDFYDAKVKLARRFHVKPESILAALRKLIALKLIIETPGRGRTRHYRVHPRLRDLHLQRRTSPAPLEAHKGSPLIKDAPIDASRKDSGGRRSRFCGPPTEEELDKRADQIGCDDIQCVERFWDMNEKKGWKLRVTWQEAFDGLWAKWPTNR